MMSSGKKAVVVGAGPIGCYVAARLVQEKLFDEVHVFEKDEDIDPCCSAGRNINLTLCKRGLDALAKINIKPGSLEFPAKELNRFCIHTSHSSCSAPYYGQCLVSVKRNDVYLCLQQKAESVGVRFHFGFTFDSVIKPKKDVNNPCDLAVTFVDNNGESHEEKCSVLLGADGVHSAVRKCVFDDITSVEYTGIDNLLQAWQKRPGFCVIQEHPLGYREITVPANVMGNCDFVEKDTFHIWGKTGLIVLGLFSGNDSLTLGVYMDRIQIGKWSAIQLQRHIEKEFPVLKDILDQIPYKQQDKKHHPGRLYSVLPSSLSRGNIALVGDAGHAMLPFLGQGLNCGLEDSCVLVDIFSAFSTDDESFIPEALSEYSKRRLKDVQTVVCQSIRECERLQLLDNSAVDVFAKGEHRHSESFFSLINSSSVSYSDALKQTSQHKPSKVKGDEVKEGEVIATYEAVKTVISITAPYDGIISDIGVGQDGKPFARVMKSANGGTESNVRSMSPSTVRQELNSKLKSPDVHFDTIYFHDVLEANYIGREVVYMKETGSNMDDAKCAASKGSPSGSVFLAEAMTKGRGRQGKTWTATPTGNIHVAILLRLPKSEQQKIQFAAALAVANTVRVEGLEVGIKWPNDIWVNGHKISGILVEAEMPAVLGQGSEKDDDESPSTDTDGTVVFILGIGVNVNDDTRRNRSLRTFATSVSNEQYGKVISREQLFANLCLELELCLEKTMENILKEIANIQVLKVSSEVVVSPKDGDEFTAYTAVVEGMTENGQLRVRKCDDQQEVTLSDLSTSLRPLPKQSVYVYKGEGCDGQSVNMLYESLITICDLSRYRIQTISSEEVKQGTWRESCALFAIGGGYDLGYLKALGDDGLQIIKDYVETGGSYLGICAGAYLACSYIEFDKSGPNEVCGERKLKFFPGKCTGPVFPGFAYDHDTGADAAEVQWRLLGDSSEEGLEDDVKTMVYINGGGCFELQDNSQCDISVEIVAKYTNIPGCIQHQAAIIKCHFGTGVAVLSGVHFEYLVEDLDVASERMKSITQELKQTIHSRDRLYVSVLKTLGL